MESDKWIRKLLALLEQMGFELQNPQRHRKVIYKGDRLSKECTLIIQSHAKDSSKRAILGYIRRELRAAGAPADMISRLDSLPISFMSEGLSIREMDEALYQALRDNDKSLIAEIGITLGKALVDQHNSYQITALDRIKADKDHQDLYDLWKKSLEDLVGSVFNHALTEHVQRHGFYEFLDSNHHDHFNTFDDDIHEKYCFSITDTSLQERWYDYFTFECTLQSELAEILTSAGCGNVLEVYCYAKNRGDGYDTEWHMTSEDDIESFGLYLNRSMSLADLKNLHQKLEEHTTVLLLK